MKKCPFCAEEIQYEAIKCKHCGEMLNKVNSDQPKTKKENGIKIKNEKKTEETEQDFFRKYGKNILYTIGTLMIIAGLSDAGNGYESYMLSLITGISIIFACLSHTGLISRLNGKPKHKKEFLPLSLLVVLLFFSFFNSPEILIREPLTIFPGIFYIGMYLYLNFINSIKESNHIDKNKGKVDFKSKMINLLIHLVYFISSILVSFLFALSDKSDAMRKGEFSEVLGSFLGSFLIVFLLGNYFYRKNRGKLGSSLKKNLSHIGKGLIGMIVLLVIYLSIFYSNISLNHKKSANEIQSTLKAIELDDDGTLNIDNMQNTETDTVLGSQMQEFIKVSSEKAQEVQNNIDSYEEIIYAEDAFVSYNKMDLSVKYHQEVINYLHKYKDEGIFETKEDFKRILGYDLSQSETYSKNINKNIELINSRINMYEKSKLLYGFYLNNFDQISVSATTGGLEIEDTIYSEYEKLYNNYSQAYDTFKAQRQAFISESQNKLDYFK